MFQLVRSFSLTSLAAMLLIGVALLLVYRHAVDDGLATIGEERNVALARALSDALWDDYAALLQNPPNDPIALRGSPAGERLRNAIRAQVRGLNIVKIKLYGLDGRTLFSSDASQIGEDQSQNPGFAAARAGRVRSDLVYRDALNAFEGVIEERNVQHSYVPVYNPERGDIIGVFEIYADVTRLVERIDREQTEIGAALVLALGLLFGVQLGYIIRADKRLRRERGAREKLEQKLQFDALHDPLTGLPNRALCRDRLHHLVELAARNPGRHFAALYLDLDRFKLVNDSLGHVIGDKLLVAAAERLGGCLRPGDTVARLGGDEFCFLLEELHGVTEAIHVAERILARFDQPFDIDRREIVATASIGIMYCGGCPADAEQILHNADTAMYQAKQQGRGRYTIFDPSMHRDAIHRIDLETELRNALSWGELLNLYQPIISLASGRVVALEALACWDHPTRGPVGGDELLPLAAEAGLNRMVDDALLDQLCADLARWREHYPGIADLPLRMNVSAGQLGDPAFVPGLLRRLAEAGIPPQQLRLELAEAALFGDLRTAEEACCRLHAAGIAVGVDAFGVGLSSPGRLRRLRIELIKIDPSLIGDGADERALVGALIGLGRNLGIVVAADGIGSVSERELLCELGCDLGQGPLIAEPLPPDRVVAHLRAAAGN